MNRLRLGLGCGITVSLLAAAPTMAATASPASTSSTTHTVTATVVPSSGVVSGVVTPVTAPATPLVYTAPAATSLGSVSVSPTGTFTYTPTAVARHAAASTSATNAAKSDNFTVTVTDGYGGTAAVPVTVAVTPQNTPPVVTAAKVTSVRPSTGTIAGTVSATDADGDSLTYTAPATIPKGTVTVNPTSGVFSFTPTPVARRAAATAAAGATAKTASFTVSVTDGYGGTAAVPVRVKVR